MTNDFHDYHKKMFLESSRPFYTNNSFSGKIFVWIVSFSYICTRNVTVVKFTTVKLYVKERATFGVALLFCYAMLFISLASPGMKAK